MALPYAQAIGRILNKEVDYDSDSIVATLHTSSYTLDRFAHDYVNDLSAELSTANGYTQGGVALTSKTVTTTVANSWADTHAVSTAFALDKVVRPSTGNTYLYRVAVAGTTAGSAPTWPTVVGTTVTDGSVTWENVGRAITVISCATISWSGTPSFTGARYCVISDRTPGTAATQPLLWVIDFTTDRAASGSGAFEVVPDAQGIQHFFIA